MRIAQRIPTDLATFLVLTAVSIITFVAIKLPDLRAAQSYFAMWDVSEIAHGLLRFRFDHGRCPATRADVLTDGRVTPAALTNPWSHGIAYRCSDTRADVRSAGRDGIFNTRDDITASLSWNDEHE